MHEGPLPAELDPRRTIASLFLHPGCDLACTFCGSDEAFDTMAPDQVSCLVDALARRGFESVVFGGGEPLLWPHDLATALARARAAGLLVQVSTHGTHLVDALVRNEDVDRFLLPLEAVDACRHDALRGAGHHARVLRAIGSCFASARAVTISTVLCRTNLAAARALAARLQEWAIRGAPLHAWHVYRFTPTGRRGRGEAAALSIEESAFKDAVAGMRASAPDVTIYRRDDFLRASCVEYFWYEEGVLRLGSSRGRS